MSNYLEAPVERVHSRNDALFKINRMIAEREIVLEDLEAAERPGTSGTASARSLMAAAVINLTATRRLLREDMYADIEQIASLLVRDVLAKVARESVEPVEFVTSNAYFPALRSFSVCESVYMADADDPDGGYWEALVEAIERHCANQGILLDGPEYDNSLYVVDLRRWEYIGEDFEGGDNLNDEWRAL